MKHFWYCLLIMMVSASCGTKVSVDIVAVSSADLTSTSTFHSQSDTSSTGTPYPTPNPDMCTAYHALDYEIYLRNYPGADHDLIATWMLDSPLNVLGRTDNGWYLLQIPPLGRAWVSAEVAQLQGLCNDLPVLTSENLRSPDYKLPCRVSSAIGNTLSLHNLTSSDSQIVGELPQGYLMEALQSTQGGWFYLKDFLGILPQGWNQGWAFESQLHLNGTCGGLVIADPPANASVILASGEPLQIGCMGQNTSGKRINLYANASEDSTLLSWILPEEHVRLSLQNDQGWVRAEYDAFLGWVQVNELQLYGDCSSLPFTS